MVAAVVSPTTISLITVVLTAIANRLSIHLLRDAKSTMDDALTTKKEENPKAWRHLAKLVGSSLPLVHTATTAR